MKTNKETMKVIAEGMEQAETCSMIDNIAEKAAEAYEEAMEFDIDEIADDLIRDLMANCLFTPRLTRDAVFVLCEWYNSINQIIICNNY